MSAFTETMRNQIRIVMTRPMNIASGIISPLLFMTLLTAPRLSRMTPEQTTMTFTGSLLASLWSAGLWSGAGILRRERSAGTLGVSFTGRPSPVSVLLGKTLGGVLYDAALILITQTIFCSVTRMPLRIGDPGAFAIGIVAVIACAVAASLMIGSVLMLSRYAFQLTTALGTPVLLLGGTLIPLSMLPPWIAWMGRLINLSWLQDFLLSTITTPRWGSLLVALAISAGYAAVGIWALGQMLHRAKEVGSLDLA